MEDMGIKYVMITHLYANTETYRNSEVCRCMHCPVCWKCKPCLCITVQIYITVTCSHFSISIFFFSCYIELNLGVILSHNEGAHRGWRSLFLSVQHFAVFHSSPKLHLCARIKAG